MAFPQVSLVSAEDAKKLLETACRHIILLEVHIERSEIRTEEIQCIPGAIPVGMDELEIPLFLEVAPDNNHTNPEHPLPRRSLHYQGGNILQDPSELRQRAQAIGISSDSTVLIYSRYSNGFQGPLVATRFLWALACCGVNDLRLIDGGLQMWRNCGYPVANEWAHRCEGIWEASLVPDKLPYLATSEDTRQIADGISDAVLCDVRSYLEFTGTCHDYSYFDALGRIPNSKWLRWGPSTYIGGAFCYSNSRCNAVLMRPLPEIRRAWAEVQLDKPQDRTVVFYCGTGWRSAMAWFVSRLLGWRSTLNYDGSWLEYSTLHPDAEKHSCETGVPRGIAKCRKKRLRPRESSTSRRKTRSDPDPSDSDTYDAEAPSLGDCLTVAKREILSRLQRCESGITNSALDDAVIALSSLAEVQLPTSCLVRPARPSSPSIHAVPSAPKWTSHEADLQLRAAVKRALREHDAKLQKPTSSKSTSTGSTPDPSTDKANAWSETSDAEDRRRQNYTSVEESQLTNAGHCTLHEADLCLRQTVHEILSTNGDRLHDLPKRLASVKRDAFAKLRFEYGARGMVECSVVEGAVRSLREAA
jgi:thiosulfate/3-mercaptopyruvate sulfurtransferase